MNTKAAANQYVGRFWIHLEFEQQAHVRQLMRAGLLKIEGRGDYRRVQSA